MARQAVGNDAGQLGIRLGSGAIVPWCNGFGSGDGRAARSNRLWRALRVWRRGLAGTSASGIVRASDVELTRVQASQTPQLPSAAASSPHCPSWTVPTAGPGHGARSPRAKRRRALYHALSPQRPRISIYYDSPAAASLACWSHRPDLTGVPFAGLTIGVSPPSDSCLTHAAKSADRGRRRRARGHGQDAAF